MQHLAGSLNAPNMYAGATAERLYRSEKVPFAFNYVDRNLDVTHDNDDQGDHGTHVSCIAAANRLDSTPVVGVAPDAQLLVMKVFGASGGAFFDDILAALEDSIVLGAHAVNVSLGTPAGFSSTSAALMNGWGTHLNLTSDPDNGIISSPSAYIGATSVASSENASIRYPYVELENGTKIPYNDVAATSLNTLYQVDPQHKAEYVMIPGYGAPEDFSGIAPSMTEDGTRAYAVSIAVIQRGVTDFVSKQFNAASAGFDTCLVYDNVVGDRINMADGTYIPNAFISKASGEAMAAAAGEHGRGVLYLKDIDDTATLPNAFAGRMSDFSSWGLSPDLDLTPEITAPGGYIYSTINNGHYGTMSGTSMAAPQIAGMRALLLQYLQEQYPNLTNAQLHTVAEALLMSTATPVMEYEGIPYSPRKQGAGLANIRDAIASPVYLTVQGRELTPKVNLGDDDTRQGVYPFSFTMHNLTDTAQSYRLEGIAMTDQFVQIDGMEFMGETSRKLDAQVTFSMGTLSAELDYNADGVVDLGDVQDFLNAVNGLLYETGVRYQLKSYYIPQYGFPLPLVYSWNCAPYYMMNAEFPALDMAFDYTTDTLYVLTDESMYLGPNTGGHLLTLDWLTGKASYVGKITGLTDEHQALTLACDNEGILYTVDAVTGDLYTIDKATGAASFVGATGYAPLYQQSMAVDHDTNKLYWAAYQDFTGTAAFLELDKATGEILSADPVEYNSQLSGLLKPYDCGRDLIPDDAAAIAGQTLQLQATVLPVSVSSVDKTVTWTSSDETVATVDENGLVTALGAGTVTITASAGSYSDSCTVTVLAEAQKFYAYDETATRWVQIDTATGALTTVHDETGLAPIMSASDVNGVIYAFDDDGYFYAIDPDTFQRANSQNCDNR